MKYFITHLGITELGNCGVRYHRFIFHFHFLARRELRERALGDDVDMSTARTSRGNHRDAGLLDETKITVLTSRRARVPLAGREIYCVYRARRRRTHWFYFDVNVNSASCIENERTSTTTDTALYAFLVDHSANASVLCEGSTHRY